MDDINPQTERGTPVTKQLSPAARRALAEAEVRRAAYDTQQTKIPHEIGGRGGKEPSRYNDWEIKGLTSDF